LGIKLMLTTISCQQQDTTQVPRKRLDVDSRGYHQIDGAAAVGEQT